MKAYLVLDLAVNDFAGFRTYIAEIQDLFKVRHATTTSRLVLADGCT